MTSPNPFAEFIGTKPVAERHRVDLAALAEWMSRKVAGFQGPLTAEQYRGGQSNPTYRLTTPSRRYVMRTKPAPAAQLLPSAHTVEREYRVMAALAETEVPVPRVHAVCEDEAVIGRAFFIMDEVEGRVLWQQDLPGASPTERTAIYDEMNRVIAVLHRLDPATVGLGDFGKPGNYFARQIARWTKQYQASITEPIEAMDRLIEWLPSRIPPEEEPRVVHGDYRLDNLIFAPDRPVIRAVLDWELATLGSAWADFSYHCTSWHVPPGAFRGIGGLDLAALGIPSEAEYRAAYCRRTGRDPVEAATRWGFYLAYNLFRIAAILQGVLKRAREGTAASPQAEDAGRRARDLAEMGWSIARRES
ncbi:MAG: phosphotransferase family protein [Gemmatimonadetes bacterium]|nr:phosphotransferase family protein [Gemmatimonadota bacterium]